MIGQRKKLIAGNWKMNGNLESLEEIELIKGSCASTDQDVIICPPSTLLVEAKKILGNTQVKVGAQNCQTSTTNCMIRGSNEFKLGKISLDSITSKLLVFKTCIDEPCSDTKNQLTKDFIMD